MASATVHSPESPHDVQTTLNYYSPIGDEPPYQYVYDPPHESTPRNNVGSEPHPVSIHDARGHESEYSLDKNGFQFVKHESQENAFTDEDRITGFYYKEVEDLLKKELGAKRVYIFDHTIRRQLTCSATLSFVCRRPDDKELCQTERGPAEYVHIDQTYDASVQRVHIHLGDEAPRLLQSRVRIINVWRPIHHPVAHKPLAVSDWRYLDTQHDLVPVRYIYPDRVGGMFNVKFNPNHRWYYLSNQTPTEVTFIKCFDSETDRARLTPHSAFLDNTSPKCAPPRESIEVRALVFDVE